MPGNYVLLETIKVLPTSVASVTFDNIPQSGYTDLKLVGTVRLTDNAAYGVMQHSFNGTSSGYLNKVVNNYSGTVYAENFNYTYVRVDANAATSTSGMFGSYEMYIPNYLSTTSKSFTYDWAQENNSTFVYHGFGGGSWANNSPISSIVITGGIAQFSTFSLYGIAATGTTPTIGPKADGGNIVANDGTYWYHAFLTSGKFTPSLSLSCNVLAVGGGGGGGGLGSGGGGGGVIPSSSLNFNVTNSYEINVGAGGPGVAAQDLSTSGGRGTDTTVSHNAGTITAFGGGGGLAYAPSSDLASKNGGSGGGGGGSSSQYAPGTGVSGQGFAGGNSMNDSSIRGGGGGGYSGIGGNASSGSGGNGAQGYNLPIAIQNILLGMTYVGSGGGGSCRQSSGSAGTGGTGASNGNNNATNVSPPTMFGCGGGSSGQTGPSQPWGASSAGYNGVVLIKYAMA